MTVDTVITERTIVTPEQTVEANVAIDDGKIAAVGSEAAIPTGRRS